MWTRKECSWHTVCKSKGPGTTHIFINEGIDTLLVYSYNIYHPVVNECTRALRIKLDELQYFNLYSTKKQSVNQVLQCKSKEVIPGIRNGEKEKKTNKMCILELMISVRYCAHFLWELSEVSFSIQLRTVPLRVWSWSIFHRRLSLPSWSLRGIKVPELLGGTQVEQPSQALWRPESDKQRDTVSLMWHAGNLPASFSYPRIGGGDMVWATTDVCQTQKLRLSEKKEITETYVRCIPFLFI